MAEHGALATLKDLAILRAAFAPAVGVSLSARQYHARYPANCDSAHQKDRWFHNCGK